MRTPLEILENLEQLRVLENGFPIVIGAIEEPTAGIDTARGLSRVCYTLEIEITFHVVHRVRMSSMLNNGVN